MNKQSRPILSIMDGSWPEYLVIFPNSTSMERCQNFLQPSVWIVMNFGCWSTNSVCKEIDLYFHSHSFSPAFFQKCILALV